MQFRISLSYWKSGLKSESNSSHHQAIKLQLAIYYSTNFFNSKASIFSSPSFPIFILSPSLLSNTGWHQHHQYHFSSRMAETEEEASQIEHVDGTSERDSQSDGPRLETSTRNRAHRLLAPTGQKIKTFWSGLKLNDICNSLFRS